jgi:hypothetical protein
MRKIALTAFGELSQYRAALSCLGVSPEPPDPLSGRVTASERLVRITEKLLRELRSGDFREKNDEKK